MARLRDVVRRFTAPVEQLDRERLERFCAGFGTTPLDEVEPRHFVRVAGEVSSVRMVPRAGSPTFEVTLSDGRGRVDAVFHGRRRVGGITPGRRMLLAGVAAREGKILMLMNPEYELLP